MPLPTTAVTNEYPHGRARDGPRRSKDFAVLFDVLARWPASTKRSASVTLEWTYGTMGVDWEQRVDFDRLRRERLARAQAAP